MDEIEIKKVVETLLFISDQPLPVERISQIVNLKENKIERALEALEEDYKERTFQIMNIAGGYQMATRQEYSLWIRRLYHNRMTVRLSAAALETLSIIAYKQPITRAEVEVIRGVEVIGPLETLLERRLITTVGRKESVGRPLLYGTTKEFLRQFGLNSLDNLPDINTLVDKDATDAAEQAMVGKPSLAEEAMDGLSTLDITEIEPSVAEQAMEDKPVEGEETVAENSPVTEQAFGDNPTVENEDNALEVEKTKEEEQEAVSLEDAVDEKLSEEIEEAGKKEEENSSSDFDNKIDEAIAEIQEKKADVSDDETVSLEDEPNAREQAIMDKSSDIEQATEEKPGDIIDNPADEPSVAEQQAMDDKDKEGL